MLAHRLRHWASMSPALGQRVVFAGLQSRSFCDSRQIRQNRACAPHRNPGMAVVSGWTRTARHQRNVFISDRDENPICNCPNSEKRPSISVAGAAEPRCLHPKQWRGGEALVIPPPPKPRKNWAFSEQISLKLSVFPGLNGMRIVFLSYQLPPEGLLQFTSTLGEPEIILDARFWFTELNE